MVSQLIQPGYLIADRYRVVHHIGEGGMGQVYLVQHAKTDERFALKILNPSVAQTPTARERFRREAKTPARIDSDHVARVVDTDIAADLDDAPFLVMEYLRGQNFQQLSESLGPLPEREVLVYMRQISIALDKAHALGIVHRDLKPENLFLTTRDDGSPCVKVLDFGIAKLSGATGDLAKVKATATGDVFGTPLYMSPEQCKSEAEKVTAKSDIWALGLIAHRLLTGDDFWTANTLTHLIAQIAYEPIPLPSERAPGFGEAYDKWFGKCCNREASERFETASDAVNGLQQALGLSAESTNQVQTHLVAAELARQALHSTPGSGSTPQPRGRTPQPEEAGDTALQESGGFNKTSEALTLERIDSTASSRWLRPPWIAAAVLAVGGLVGAALFFGSAGGDAEPPAPAAAPTTTTTSELPAEPEPTIAEEPATETSAPTPSADTSATQAKTAASPPIAKPTPKYVPQPKVPQPPPKASGNPLDRRH